jgi:hypothetical protein
VLSDRIVLIRTDLPTLPPSHVVEALTVLEVSEPCPELFKAIAGGSVVCSQ